MLDGVPGGVSQAPMGTLCPVPVVEAGKARVLPVSFS